MMLDLNGRDFRHVKVGDTVRRMLAGVVPMDLVVSEIDDQLIHCGDWTFDRDTGAEVDLELGWDGKTKTGSYLTGVIDG